MEAECYVLIWVAMDSVRGKSVIDPSLCYYAFATILLLVMITPVLCLRWPVEAHEVLPWGAIQYQNIDSGVNAMT